jgi:hypothetical protein
MTSGEPRARKSGSYAVRVLCAEPRGPVLRLLTALRRPGVYASVAAAADSPAGSAGSPAAWRRVLSSVRYRAAPAGAWYWWALRTAPAPGARARGRSRSPRWLRARSGLRG